VETCRCGVRLREFWLWEDGNAILHASSFPPTQGSVRPVYAATSRDATIPFGLDPRAPKHDVRTTESPTQNFEGRCTVTLEQVS
jgi:hypothetical protein